MDVGARGDQGGEAALGDLAAAEDGHAAAGEAEAYGVGGVFGHQVRLLGQAVGQRARCGCGASLTWGFYARVRWGRRGG
ncbi:hypothetical protein SHKM778_63610 [Streptomyces sp. KM77-8]|uniref:Uncharacterized protein n=1 Tax=Streptomyces haneummycinicus TaxID=3074435 RepID=A0AAT9HRL7_9ACTN